MGRLVRSIVEYSAMIVIIQGIINSDIKKVMIQFVTHEFTMSTERAT